MLTIIVNGKEHFDEEKEVFFNDPSTTVELEHSLVSLSKWESIYKKPFLTKDDKTYEETLSYVECMILRPKISPEVFLEMINQDGESIKEYMASDMSATWFNEPKFAQESSRPEIITSELIYYWMVSFNIPFECQHWHLSRLLKLIKVCSVKNAPPRKLNAREASNQREERRRLNEQRKAQFNTSG